MVGIAALVFWLILDSEEPGQPSGGNIDTTPDISAVEAPASAAATVLPETVKDTPAVAAALPAAPDAVERPAPVAVDSVPATAQAVKKPVTPVVKATPAPVIQKPDAPEQVAAAAPVPASAPVFRDQLKNGSKGPLMAGLPGASYMMGSSGNSLNFDEGPRHQVTLTGFSISKHEVSFSEYDRFARATGRRLPHDEGWGRKDRPVINVSWHDANAYAAWLSKQTGKTYRLPSESEWEYAARAGSLEQYWWGGAADTVPANCFNCGSKWGGSRTAPVGSFVANNFGLHDMAGNVQEWTQDCYRAGYADAPVDGSARLAPECTQRAVRGGAYTSPQDSLRSARRGQYDQDTRLDNLGFRVVREN
jgi:formylglycine-generating enzyme required for sulfatase activity